MLRTLHHVATSRAFAEPVECAGGCRKPEHCPSCRVSSPRLHRLALSRHSICLARQAHQVGPHLLVEQQALGARVQGHHQPVLAQAPPLRRVHAALHHLPRNAHRVWSAAAATSPCPGAAAAPRPCRPSSPAQRRLAADAVLQQPQAGCMHSYAMQHNMKVELAAQGALLKRP